MSGRIANAKGGLGEKVAGLLLSRSAGDGDAMFSVAFLGDKWEATDLLVVPEPVPGLRPYFFAQVKATASPPPTARRGLAAPATKAAVAKLLEIPGPTYLLGVHLPSERVFAKAVLAGAPARGVGRFPLANELTPDSLRTLREEVVDFWPPARRSKPTESHFR